MAVQAERAEQENYFIPMLDMVVGVLFIFIILLVFTYTVFKERYEDIQGLQSGTTIMVENFCDSLSDQKVDITCEPGEGRIVFKSDGMFETGKADLTEEGLRVVNLASRQLSNIIFCKATILDKAFDRSLLCRADQDYIKLDVLLIEGHSDTRPYRGSEYREFRNNRDLSSTRSEFFTDALYNNYPEFDRAVNQDCKSIFSHSGYGAKRPLNENCVGNADSACHKQNRRIEMRFIMELEHEPKRICS